MSGGHFRNKLKYQFFETIGSGTAVTVNEQLSHLDSTTSNNLLLISKIEKPKVPGTHDSTARIVKVVDVQVRKLKMSIFLEAKLRSKDLKIIESQVF